jgi:hypothetical protein
LPRADASSGNRDGEIDANSVQRLAQRKPHRLSHVADGQQALRVRAGQRRAQRRQRGANP